MHERRSRKTYSIIVYTFDKKSLDNNFIYDLSMSEQPVFEYCRDCESKKIFLAIKFVSIENKLPTSVEQCYLLRSYFVPTAFISKTSKYIIIVCIVFV